VIRIASIGIATSLIAGAAFAADLPSRNSAPFYSAPPPLFTWTGFYGGINGGLGIGGFTHGGSNYFGNTSGGLAGGTIGYNYQGGPIVVGVEADLDWADINGHNNPGFGVNGSATINETNSVRGRLGYAFDRVLVYATGGWSAANVSGNVANFGSTPNLLINESHYLNGYAVGAGVEYSITPRVSVKAEYLFNSLSPNSYFAGTPSTIHAGVDYSTLRAGVNYHF
jgi:outer membrane immunogenic protein